MTYILKWNPDISSINLTEWEYWIQHFPFIKPNWNEKQLNQRMTVN